MDICEERWFRAQDPSVKSFTEDLVARALLARQRWAEFLLATEEAAAEFKAAGLDSLIGMRPLVESWAAAPREVWHYPYGAQILPMKVRRNGQAMLRVHVNGLPCWFIVDTGCTCTAISPSLVSKAGISPSLLDGG
jgi:predicted aspartyl protease